MYAAAARHWGASVVQLAAEDEVRRLVATLPVAVAPTESLGNWGQRPELAGGSLFPVKSKLQAPPGSSGLAPRSGCLTRRRVVC